MTHGSCYQRFQFWLALRVNRVVMSRRNRGIKFPALKHPDDWKVTMFMAPTPTIARKWTLGLLLAVVLFASTAGYAYAHYVYAKKIVWNVDNDRCLIMRSEISHGSGGGYSKVRAWTTTTAYVPCVAPWDRNAGQIGAQWNLQKWDVDEEEWALCAYSVYAYNTEITNEKVVEYDFGDEPWCGAGHYATAGDGRIQDVEGDWVYRSLWSGSHHFQEG